MTKTKYIVLLPNNHKTELWACSFVVTQNGDLVFVDKYYLGDTANICAFAAGSWVGCTPDKED